MMAYTRIATAVLMVILVAWLLTLRAEYGATKSDVSGPVSDQLTTSWVAKQRLLADYEREQSKLRLAVIKQRKLYQDGKVSKEQLVETEQSFITTLVRIQEVRRLLTETEIALAETEMRGEPSAPAAIGDLPQAKRLPYNGRGNVPWSISEAPNIEKYFFQTFGHNLPVSALGQTPTHDRLRFDHRNAMDVALHPDSMEGKALIAYLQRSAVPFIAFRSAAAGASTGAHIHIGRPSRRMAA
jgi:hypothetical protein